MPGRGGRGLVRTSFDDLVGSTDGPSKRETCRPEVGLEVGLEVDPDVAAFLLLSASFSSATDPETLVSNVETGTAFLRTLESFRSRSNSIRLLGGRNASFEGRLPSMGDSGP